MNWVNLRRAPWLDTRARFVAATPAGGRLLDLGSSDGETLRHLNELRPDLKFCSVDIEGHPENYPPGCEFHRANLEKDRLPWPDHSLDAITCMHVVEHLHDCHPLVLEVARLLKPGGRAYIETPHPKTVMLPSPRGIAAGTFTLNFYDDLTHVRPVAVGALAQLATRAGLVAEVCGTSRNWLFAASWLLYAFSTPSRKKYTARIHWLGWSAYVILRKPL
jgi:SAM-dependent methyltransferase